MNNKKIGVFDSGLGGLTSVKELIKIVPGEDIVYFGDTGRVPYGTRSEETIIKYTKQDIAFLKSFDIKIILVACGTVSSVALPFIKNEEVKIVGVVKPASRAAVKATRNGKIGVIGTTGTIKSNSYKKTIEELSSDAKVYQQACPLFVPLVENGYFDHEATKIIAREYLKPLMDEGVDTIILGCTHYPILKKVIGEIVGENVVLIDSGKAAADYVKEILEEDKILSDKKEGNYEFCTSDRGDFQKLAQIFLEREISEVKVVDIEKVKIDE